MHACRYRVILTDLVAEPYMQGWNSSKDNGRQSTKAGKWLASLVALLPRLTHSVDLVGVISARMAQAPRSVPAHLILRRQGLLLRP